MNKANAAHFAAAGGIGGVAAFGGGDLPKIGSDLLRGATGEGDGEEPCQPGDDMF